MWKPRVFLIGLTVLASLVAVTTALPGTHRPAKCTPGYGAHQGICTDPVGDVKGGPGPDITRVTESEWGSIGFNVTFAKPLAHSATFTDTVTVQLWATGKTTKRFVLSVSAAQPETLATLLPNGKRIVKNSGEAPPYISGKKATLSLALESFGVWRFVRYRVKAARETVNGQPGGVDYAPDTGTMVWHNPPLG